MIRERILRRDLDDEETGGPAIVGRDAARDAIFGEPTGGPAWSLDGHPEHMGTKALCAAVARDILGCEPTWSGYYCDWCCSCKGIPHACDSQCSAIADANQLRARTIWACEAKGIMLPAIAHPAEQLRAALTAWRASL